MVSIVLMGCGQTGPLFLPNDYGKCANCDVNVDKSNQSDNK